MNNHSHDTLRDDWMTWFVLRHFLPVSAQRELAQLLVHALTEGHHSLEDVIEEIVIPGPFWNEAWLFRERETKDEVVLYLQRVVSGMAWQNDAESIWAVTQTRPAPSTKVTPDLVALLLQLGVADFMWPKAFTDRYENIRPLAQPGLNALFDAFRLAQEHRRQTPEDIWQRLDALLSGTTPPLRFAGTKHLADLYADMDEWKVAAAGYALARSIAQAWAPTERWSDIYRAWTLIALQSQAAAARVIDGPAKAAQMLTEAANRSLADTPLGVANAAFDAFVCSSHPAADGFSTRDTRTRLLRSPLLIEAHTSEHAMRHWLQRHFDDSRRHWWELLRRQVALGSAHDARSTMAMYARTIFDGLNDTVLKDFQPDQFGAAVRLLVESGRADAASRINWTVEMVDSYVAQSVVDEVIVRVQAFEGVRSERQLVAIALFKEWVKLLSPANSSIAIAMWRALTSSALDGRIAFEAAEDVGRPALEALRELARQRPEWAAVVAADVARAVLAKLKPDETWWAFEAALKAAYNYLDKFSADDLREIVGATLNVLDAIPPEQNLFPVVGPALRMLIAPAVRRHADPAQVQRILATILRLGATQESERDRVIFYLHDFDPALLRDAKVREQLAPAIDEMRRIALRPTRSDVSQSINGLLLAPAISGRAGILDALDGLRGVLTTASSTRRASPGLAYAYDAILDLCSGRDVLAREVEDEGAWRERIATIATALVALWEHATKQPALLAPFSFPPPTRADATTVHNWAFASARFAEAFEHPAVLDALDKASSVPDLMNNIQLARATHASDMGHEFSVQQALTQARSETREGFYTALGRWLVLLELLAEKPGGTDLNEVLLSQVLKFGPRHQDAPVLLAAVRRGLGHRAIGLGLEDYAMRLRAEEDLNLMLGPMLRLLKGNAK